MKAKYIYPLLLGCIFILLFLSKIPASLALGDKINCLKCHRQLTNKKSVHLALAMGCSSCHSGIDAGTVPHKKTNSIAKGLASDLPDLCFSCHSEEPFTAANVHPALMSVGCTGCHDPHSSKNEKLILSSLPQLCFSCHDKVDFGRKNVHPPVAAGSCTACHTPHSSGEMALLLDKPSKVCLKCHRDIDHGDHYSPANGSATSPWKKRQDPMRPGKPFYCGSCHHPHSSDTSLLFRFNARSKMELCLNCHPKF